MQEAQGELPISQSNPDAQTNKDSNVPEVAENGSVEDGKVEKEAVDERMEEDLPIDIYKADDPFYLRYYSGHQGKFGHEFLEFDLSVQLNGSYATLRYANNSNYRNEGLIRKQCMCGIFN
jgi:hypothetical protein